MDHGGANLSITSRDVIWGVHTNIRIFAVWGDEDIPAVVKPYNPGEEGTGFVSIEAEHIGIYGGLSAKGAGYTGGGAGAGEGHTMGLPGSGNYSGFEGQGRLGSPGDGPYGGVPGTEAGYLGDGINGDETTDRTVYMGSGGCGGDGCLGNDGAGGGGGGGGTGGGAIILSAMKSILIMGEVDASGAYGGNGLSGYTPSSGECVTPEDPELPPYCDTKGGKGGSSSPPKECRPGSGSGYCSTPDCRGNRVRGQDGLKGGMGAGGGILLECATPGGINLYGLIRSDGASKGTVKVFQPGMLPNVPPTRVYSGRLYIDGIEDFGIGPMDHGGADFIAAAGQQIYGRHVNVGRFVVPDGVTLGLYPYHPLLPDSGELFVEAREILIDGCLDSTGSGYTGGGGRGGDGSEYYNTGSHGYPRYSKYSSSDDLDSGDGPFQGYTNSVDGGYLGFGGNGDVSVDKVVWRGSGGKGGDGGYGSTKTMGGCGGGGGGGSGGGAISLIATQSLRVNGSILTRGSAGQRGSSGWPATCVWDVATSSTICQGGAGGRGGDALPFADGIGGAGGVGCPAGECSSDGDGFAGFPGGSGAGGGILLECLDGRGLQVSGTLNALGGRSQQSNGGTIKILAHNAPADLEGASIQAGRIFQPSVFFSSHDHGGEDVTIFGEAVCLGKHTNIGTLHLLPDARLTVYRYHPDEPESGAVSFEARRIIIEGTIDATGAGYTGGGGGGYIPGESNYPGFGRVSSGSPGDGPFAGGVGSDGGYAAPLENGDSSKDEIVLIGSGGGGGSCPDITSITRISETGKAGSGGGGGGGTGGGAVCLIAEKELAISGQILTRGVLGGNGTDGEPPQPYSMFPEQVICFPGDPGDGGDSFTIEEGKGGMGGTNYGSCAAEPPAPPGQDGGSGAGGGILLKCDSPDGLTITGTLDSSGGRGPLPNGGTIKVFQNGASPNLDAATISAGRVYTRGTATGDGWMLN